MLEIDGSYGEGGGQILRNAIAISTYLKKPVKITNIRANRPNPGIKAQHYVSIKCIQEICDAEVEGLEIGSSNLTFKPGNVKGGRYRFDIGTAGSITLVYQACILASLKTKEPITISLTGGTDVKWSPSWDYFQYVFLPLIKKMGVVVFPNLIIRGYYPKGGGEAILTINPTDKLMPLKTRDYQDFAEVMGRINISNLPGHITNRIKHTAIKAFMKNDMMTSIDVETSTSLSPGVGITLWSQTNDALIGAGVLGDKGVTSEEVGISAANNLLKEIQSYSTVDRYAFDQILPYMVIAKKNGASNCIVCELTNHASTNLWLLKQFFNVDFEASQSYDNIEITIK